MLVNNSHEIHEIDGFIAVIAPSHPQPPFTNLLNILKSGKKHHITIIIITIIITITGWWFGTFFSIYLGFIPKWPYFRLVNYYNLPRYMAFSMTTMQGWLRKPMIIPHEKPSFGRNRLNRQLKTAGWCFGTYFIFPYIGNNHPN